MYISVNEYDFTKHCRSMCLSLVQCMKPSCKLPELVFSWSRKSGCCSRR